MKRNEENNFIKWLKEYGKQFKTYNKNLEHIFATIFNRKFNNLNGKYEYENYAAYLTFSDEQDADYVKEYLIHRLGYNEEDIAIRYIVRGYTVSFFLFEFSPELRKYFKMESKQLDNKNVKPTIKENNNKETEKSIIKSIYDSIFRKEQTINQLKNIKRINRDDALEIYNIIISLIYNTNSNINKFIIAILPVILKEILNGLNINNIDIHKSDLGYIIADLTFNGINILDVKGDEKIEHAKLKDILTNELKITPENFSNVSVSNTTKFRIILTEIEDGFEDKEIITYFKTLRNCMHDSKDDDFFMDSFKTMLHDIFKEMTEYIIMNERESWLHCEFANNFEKLIVANVLCKYFGFTKNKDLILSNNKEFRLNMRGKKYRELEL